jgi:hypothetical protein
LSNRTAKVIAWLNANYAKPSQMEELAEVARMGKKWISTMFLCPSSFYWQACFYSLAQQPTDSRSF